MVAFTKETEMLAIILFSVYLAPLKAVDIQQPWQQIVKGPIPLLPPAPYLLPALAPIIPYPTGSQVPPVSQVEHQLKSSVSSAKNCQSAEMLQNVLSLLNRLVSQENISQLKQPKEAQLEILALLKKYLDIKEPHVDNDNKEKVEEDVDKMYNIVEHPNQENPTNHIRAELSLKYDIPNTSCKDTINTLIQTLYEAYSRINFICKQTGKCNVDSETPHSHSHKLPSIFSDLALTLTPKDLNKIYDVPKLYDLQNQISGYQANPENYVELNPKSAANLNLQLNKVPSNKHNENIHSEHNEFLTEQLYAKEFNKQENFGEIPHVSVPAINYLPKKILSFDDFYKANQDLNGKFSVVDGASAIANNNKQIYLNYQLPPNLQVHNSLGAQVPNGNIYTSSGNLLKPILDPESQNVPMDPVFNKAELSQLQIIKQLFPKQSEVIYQDKPLFSHEGNVNHRGHPIISVNPHAASDFSNYLQQDVYGTKLLDSQHSASVHNLVKLNSASDNNGIVELTYVLAQPEPLATKRYHYIKYRLPYKSFLLKVFDLTKNPMLKADPLRFNEELLSASKLADVSPDLRTIGKKELTDLIKQEGALVDAKVLPENYSKTEEYLNTIQKLNYKLNTNEILNLVQNGTKPKKDLTDASSNVKLYKLHDDELSSKFYHDPSLIISSNPYFTNDPRKFLPSPLPNTGNMNSLNPLPTLPSNNINPRAKYNTAISPQLFTPYSLSRTKQPQMLLAINN